MTPERYQQVKELFQSALEREVGQRKRFLAEACAGDCLCEMKSSHSSHRTSKRQASLNHPRSRSSVKCCPISQTKQMVGQRIGPYKVIREIAHGGMGAVYLAFRADDEYQKRVGDQAHQARAWIRTRSCAAFARRQVLAGLGHAHIARLLDGGATAEGLPYFAMEYVEGLPFDGLCDERQLSTVERLKLFQRSARRCEHLTKISWFTATSSPRISL